MNQTTELAIVAALSDNGVIGRGNDLPWKLPDDMKFFMELTRGNTVIMGRRTFDSMNGRPLPKRRNIVVTRQASWKAEGVEAAGSLEEAVTLGLRNPQGRLFVVGGAEIYAQALQRPDLTTMYLTRVNAQVPGDTHFPQVDWSQWRLVDRREHPADPRHAYAFAFEIYEKSSKG